MLKPFIILCILIVSLTQDTQCQKEVEMNNTLKVIDNIFVRDKVIFSIETVKRYQKQITELDARTTIGNGTMGVFDDLLDFVAEQIIISIINFERFKREIKYAASEVTVSTTFALEGVVQDALMKLGLKPVIGLENEIKECINKNRKILENLAKEHKSNLNNCIQDKIKKVENTGIVALQQIQRLGNTTQELIEEIRTCNLNPPAVDCINIAINNAFFKVFDIMFEITFEAFRAASVFPRTTDDIKQCGVEQIDDITLQVKENMEHIKGCFKNTGLSYTISYMLIGATSFLYLIRHVQRF